MMILQVNTIKWYVMKSSLLRIPPELGWYRRPTIQLRPSLCTYDFPAVTHWYMLPHERLHDSICLTDGTVLPTGCPGLIRVFSSDFEKLKLAELLPFCGDRGKYLVEFLDVNPILKHVFIHLLDLMGKFIRAARLINLYL